MQTEWSEFNPHDESTHPENGRTVEFQYPSGRVVEMIVGEVLSGVIGQWYCRIVAEEGGTERRWRYV
jgi:hypothetical protein